MSISDKIGKFLNEERVNVKTMSPEELAKAYLSKADGDPEKARKIIFGYSTGKTGEALEKLNAAAKLLHVSKPHYYYGKKVKDGAPNPTVNKLKNELEKEKKENSSMSFKQLPEKFKKEAARNGAGENSIIVNKGNDWKKALGNNPLYIKGIDKNYLVVPSYKNNEYTIFDDTGNYLSWEEHKYERPTKRNGNKGKSYTIANRNFKKNQMYKYFDDAEEIHEIFPDKIRKDIRAEKQANLEKERSKNPNSDISGAVIDKYLNKANEKTEEKLKQQLLNIISKTGTNDFDINELNKIRDNLYNLHQAKNDAKHAKGKELYSPAEYAYDYEKKKYDTSKLSDYGRGSRLTYTGKDIIGRINKILGKGSDK